MVDILERIPHHVIFVSLISGLNSNISDSMHHSTLNVRAVGKLSISKLNFNKLVSFRLSGRSFSTSRLEQVNL